MSAAFADLIAQPRTKWDLRSEALRELSGCTLPRNDARVVAAMRAALERRALKPTEVDLLWLLVVKHVDALDSPELAMPGRMLMTILTEATEHVARLDLRERTAALRLITDYGRLNYSRNSFNDDGYTNSARRDRLSDTYVRR